MTIIGDLAILPGVEILDHRPGEMARVLT